MEAYIFGLVPQTVEIEVAVTVQEDLTLGFDQGEVLIVGEFETTCYCQIA